MGYVLPLNKKVIHFFIFRPKRDEILKHCRYLVRKLHYEEMAKADPYKAMHYLRHHIAEVIDHNNEEQLKNVIAQSKSFVKILQNIFLIVSHIYSFID